MTLHDESWSWTLERIPEGLLLTVLCGSVGLYERSLMLEPDEVRLWEHGGPAALEPLVEGMRNDSRGNRFGERYLSGPHPGEPMQQPGRRDGQRQGHDE